MEESSLSISHWMLCREHSTQHNQPKLTFIVSHYDIHVHTQDVEVYTHTTHARTHAHTHTHQLTTIQSPLSKNESPLLRHALMPLAMLGVTVYRRYRV